MTRTATVTPPRRPEPLAELAHADQLRAARADAARVVMELIAAGARVLPADRPWAARMFDSAPGGRGCPNAINTGPQPLFLLYPGRLLCPECFTTLRAQLHAVPPTCLACGHPDDWLRDYLACRDLTIAYGRLCLSCGYA